MPKGKSDPFVVALDNSFAEDGVYVDRQSLRIVDRPRTETCAVCGIELDKKSRAIAFSRRVHIRRPRRGSEYACVDRHNCHARAAAKKEKRKNAVGKRSKEVSDLKKFVKKNW